MKKNKDGKKEKTLLLLLLVIISIVSCIFYAYELITKKPIQKEDKKPEIKDEKIDIPEEDKIVELTMVGDFLYEEPYYKAISAGESKDLYFSKVKKYFQNDGLSLGNMEVVIGNENLKVSGTGFNFCAPEYVGHQVISLGMDVLATANNHSNDRGYEGRLSTLDFFKNNSNITTVGTYKEDIDITRGIREENGIKFGFLSYTYGTNIKVEPDLRSTIGLFRDPDGKDHASYEQKLSEEVSALRKQVDVLIVFMHWGVEFTYTPNESQKNLAALLNSLGVDIIVGSHSHSIEPIEWIRTDKHDTLVYYSLGNFVSADDDISRTGETFDNAYQFGLLSKVDIRKAKDNIYIENIRTEPIINYYDENMTNFQLVPLTEYNEKLEKSHYRYKYNFDRNFIEEAYNRVIDDEYRQKAVN